MSSSPSVGNGGSIAPAGVAPDEDSAAEPGTGPQRRRRRNRVLAVLGVALLVTALGGFGWAGYQYLGTTLLAQRHYDAQRTELRSRWQQPAPAPAEVPAAEHGEAVALLRVPAFGADYEVPVLEGTDLDVLGRGLGHYRGTAQPGEVGNFALAGHRVTHGQPFARLLRLREGDEVVIETRSAVHTYVLDQAPRDLTVRDTAGWVLEPVPGRPAARPTRALITLTTAQDLVRSPDRSVGFGHLESTRNK